MHIYDAHNDNLVASETALHAHTRAQTQAADAVEDLDDPIILTTSSDDQTKSPLAKSPLRAKIAPPLPCTFATTTDKIALPLPRTKIAPLPPRAFASTSDETTLSDELANHNELAIARAFIQHLVEFVKPPHYRPM